LGQREIAPVEARDEQLFAVGIDETGKTDADAFDGAVVIANIFARAIDDLFRSLLGVGTGFKLFLLVRVVPKSTPMATASAVRSDSRIGGRPPVDSPLTSSINPSIRNSSTISETVERCSAVSWAISAREMGPLSRT
jgi:hypothetical protein